METAPAGVLSVRAPGESVGMSTLLAIDTATEACSVAVLINGEVIERYEELGREHSLRLPGMVAAVLAEAGIGFRALDGLVCGIGPGSFAGVRIGVSFAKGLALGLDKPVAGITSLAMLAEAAAATAEQAPILAAIDARMGEVYFGRFSVEAGHVTLRGPELVCAPEAIPELAEAAVCVGTGWHAHADAMRARLGQPPVRIDGAALPRAAAALGLAAPRFAELAQDGSRLVPAYLRNRVALTKVEQDANRAAAAKR